MVTVKQIYDFIDNFAPFEDSLSFDNTGLLIGNPETEVTKVLLSLDITSKVIKEAIDTGANLMITHHPVIFNPVRSLRFDDLTAKMIKNNINALCAHTNLDIAAEGVNFHLAKKLKLANLETLTHEENKPMGLTGFLKQKMLPKEFAEFVKTNLECFGLRYTVTDKKIKKVGVCSGAGGCFVYNAKQKECDAFVTGEIKHSDILKANELELMIVDAGHYKTENIVLKPLSLKLRNKFQNLEFILSQTFTDNIRYI